jgi:hypothetical protein
MAKVRFCMPLENGGNAFCIFQAAIPGEPTRRLRKKAAEYPNYEGACPADQHEPPPTLNAQRSVRHQEPAQQGECRHGRLDDREGEGKRSSAEIARNYLRGICVECNQLSTDRNRGDQAYGIDRDGRVLYGHHGRRRGVAERKTSEGRASSPAIRDSSQSDRSHKQAKKGNGRKGCLVGQMEETVRACLEDAAANETWTNERRHEKFIELEEAAQRQQCDQFP